MDADFSDELAVCNGIDGVTGGYAVNPVSVEAIADVARSRLRLADVPTMSRATRSGVPFAVMNAMSDLSEMGWGVIFAGDVRPDVRAALKPLLDRRREQAGPLFQELEFEPGVDSFRSWLARHQVAPGDRNETKVPFYLLIVGQAASIPFEFQYLLDVEYHVGRLAFSTAAEYAAYADSVVAYERTGARLTAREMVYWGTRHEGDLATELSAEHLLAPLATGCGDRPPVAAARRFQSTLCAEDQGTKANLLEVLHRPSNRLPPALLFTASHGLSWPSGHARQAENQGALVCQEWDRYDSIEPRHYVAAADIGDDARVHGMMAFAFACFGAGTPALDHFRELRAEAPDRLAERPFLSALPQRLLAHPGGGALAVIGHVDRAWGCSIRPRGAGTQIGAFRACLDILLRGLPAGLATADFSQRFATLSANLLTFLDGFGDDYGQVTDRELAQAWIERNDAQSYVLLGDPAARLRPELMV